MTMDIDALVKVFDDAFEGPESRRDAVRAVVEALRDEIEDTYEREGCSWDGAHAYNRFNEILGDAGEKAAGGPTREDGPDVVISSVQAPAADLGPQDDGILIGNQNVEAIINDLHDEQKSKSADHSPEVCEWMLVVSGAERDIYDVSCHSESISNYFSDRPYTCPSCGKPIAFKEAK